MDARLRALATLSVCLLAATSSATAQDVQSEAPANTFSLRTSIKMSGLAFKTPDWPELYPERTGAESMWRLRVEPELRPGRNVVFTVAYEQQLRYASSAAGLTTVGILPSQAPAPYRLVALDWGLTASSGATWRHEIDRASAQFHFRRADVTVGRQAIGWGRGVMFGAVDLFAPFSPLEADREWRRGVDAVRADITLTDRSSLDIVGALDKTWDRSAVVARVRGFSGPIDVEAMGGRRAQDWFGGMTTSAAVGDAELHGELAAFRVPPDALEDETRLVWKAVVGGSYRLPIGSGIVAFAEYHYSGFGAARPRDILVMLSTPDFRERYLRGDTQILSRHAIALTGSYEVSPELMYSGQWVHNPKDRSGVVAPSVTYTRSDHVSLLGATYIPYGPGPRAQAFRSEFGTALLSVLVQLRIYL